MDLSLFPTNEEWGTGDEAMDNKLSIALKKSTSLLSFQSISDFYFLGMSLKTRAYNPSFGVTIELVTKALFSFFNPEEPIDHQMKKMKGDYAHKKRVPFELDQKIQLIEELKMVKKFRYSQQIDFALQLQDGKERNPYTPFELKRSTMDLSVKIIFKEFKSFLNQETKAELFTEPFFVALRGGEQCLFIENFAEIWYHQDQIYALSHFDL